MSGQGHFEYFPLTNAEQEIIFGHLTFTGLT